MKSLMRTATNPIAVQKSRRRHPLRVLTSLKPGKMMPLAVIPMLREDRLDGLSLRASFEMDETAEVLMNSVNVNMKAYLVPHLAFDRFSGMDELNRSFSGLPNQEGGPVTPYFNESLWSVNDEIHKYLGKHHPSGMLKNKSYIEAYNQIWNFRARNRSKDITLRAQGDHTLAPAFWQHEMFAHIVPDFDQAAIDGSIPIRIPNTQLPVKNKPGGVRVQADNVSTVGQMTIATGNGIGKNGSVPPASQVLQFAQDATGSNVFAELTASGIQISLADIDLARKTQAFAKLREQFSGLTDEYIIDLLMDGITIPEQAFRQPILLAEQSTVFGMSKRYASDAGNLAESAVNGMTQIDMRIRCPTVPMGGVIMVVAEITPDQLFERQLDPYMQLSSPEEMPHYLRDTLDPEKVEIVRNKQVDTSHGLPEGLFGYAPLNHRWSYAAPCVGGKFYRPEIDSSFDEVRQRIWAVENTNPRLSESFYIVKGMHQKPFLVTTGDPFEVVIRGEGIITGNTVFGGYLNEGDNEYAEVLAEADQTRITKP